jgi:hypothetical protein
MSLISGSSNHEAFTMGKPYFIFWMRRVQMLGLEIAVHNQ